MGYKITAIRVQDIMRSKWFNWNNGVWDSEPEITAWGGVYVSFWAVSDLTYVSNPTLQIYHEGELYEQRKEVQPGAGVGFEWSGGVSGEAVASMKVRVYHSSGSDEVSFTCGVYHAPSPEPEPVPVPGGSVSKPALLLAGFPVAVRCLWVLRESLVPAYVHSFLHPLI